MKYIVRFIDGPLVGEEMEVSEPTSKQGIEHYFFQLKEYSGDTEVIYASRNDGDANKLVDYLWRAAFGFYSASIMERRVLKLMMHLGGEASGTEIVKASQDPNLRLSIYVTLSRLREKGMIERTKMVKDAQTQGVKKIYYKLVFPHQVLPPL
jgi:hypothetical protein